MKKVFRASWLLTVFVWVNPLWGRVLEASSLEQGLPHPGACKEENTRFLSLEECIDIALKNNRQRPASQFAIAIAEAQYQQALSAWWPQVVLNSALNRMDENPNFIFPAEESSYLAWSALAPVWTLARAQVPEKKIKIMDRDTLVNSLTLTYPLYTGGMRRAIVKQARCGLKAATQEARRTDLKVIYDVKRMYYSCVLAHRLYEIGNDALKRLEATLKLTEHMYTKGAGSVKKTDHLRNKTIVEAVRSTMTLLKTNEYMGKAALINSMGLDWNTSLELSENEIPFEPYQVQLEKLISSSYLLNPDWMRLEIGLMVAKARIKEAKSGFLPTIALMGTLNRIDNEYHYGAVSPENKNSWTVGVVLEFPIFNGFLTRHKIREARALLRKREQEKVLLRKAIALQVKYIFLQMARGQKQQAAARTAMQAAEENRELNVRAYEDELVETKEVIEAQLIESFMKAQHQKALYDHVEAQAHLDFVIGREVHKLLEGETDETP